MNTFKVEFFREADAFPIRTFKADRFSVYGRGKIAFYVDRSKATKFLGMSLANSYVEVVAEIQTDLDFIVEKINE